VKPLGSAYGAAITVVLLMGLFRGADFSALINKIFMRMHGSGRF
jgi:hypothetical protein